MAMMPEGPPTPPHINRLPDMITPDFLWAVRVGEGGKAGAAIGAGRYRSPTRLWGVGLYHRVIACFRTRKCRQTLPFAKNSRWRFYGPSGGALLGVEGWRHTYIIITIRAMAIAKGKTDRVGAWDQPADARAYIPSMRSSKALCTYLRLTFMVGVTSPSSS